MRAGLIGLWRWTAWGGIGLSLYAGWLTADDLRDRASSERDISAACDGLVSGAAVMDLQGGMIRAKASDYDEYRIDTRELHSSCTVYKVPGPGKTTSLFTLVVRRSDASEPMNWIGDDSGLEPFYDTDDTEVLGGQDAIIEAGTAGHADGAWWASSVCDGKPALHTLSSSYTYDDILGSRRLNTLFRAYVDDITKRRGCTDVTYPDAKDFRSL
ncbi:hypothetical protein OHU34_06325 [Streptomyces sp. NBC_00080]|uniref:hypothetical protein n=1 Tax=Streptomyces sp. NBC_00080 TaxID=2975645 RepID=UPI00324CF9ED